MKIAVLSSHTPSLFWFRIDMMQTFIERGHTVFALGNEPESEWQDKFAEKGIIYRRIHVQRNGTHPIQDARSVRSIKRVLAEIRPDKIFTYQAKTVTYGTAAANKLGITEVYPLIAGLGSLFLSDGLKTRIVRRVLVAGYKNAMRRCPAVFFQNHDDLETFRRLKVIRDQKITMLRGSGVNLDRFTVQPPPDVPTFLCISRLIRDKGVYEYLEACRRVRQTHPNVRCLLVGPFDTNPSSIKPAELQSYIDDGSIEYFGEQADVVPYIAQCSVYVLPSYREGTPKTVLEAMACRRAVITTDVPGCRETIEHNEQGLLVPAKDVEKLAAAMVRLAESPDLVDQMAAKGRQKAEEVFDVKKVNAMICETMGI